MFLVERDPAFGGGSNRGADCGIEIMPGHGIESGGGGAALAGDGFPQVGGFLAGVPHEHCRTKNRLLHKNSRGSGFYAFGDGRGFHRLGHSQDEGRTRTAGRGDRVHLRFLDFDHHPDGLHELAGKCEVGLLRAIAQAECRNPGLEAGWGVGHHPHHCGIRAQCRPNGCASQASHHGNHDLPIGQRGQFGGQGCEILRLDRNQEVGGFGGIGGFADPQAAIASAGLAIGVLIDHDHVVRGEQPGVKGAGDDAPAHVSGPKNRKLCLHGVEDAHSRDWVQGVSNERTRESILPFMSSSGFNPAAQLDFEAPVTEIDRQIETLVAKPDAERYGEEVDTLRETRESMLRKIYASLTPWQVVRVARHPERPQAEDYIRMMCRDFCELHGDRAFGDDPAMITGIGRIGSRKVMLVCNSKGRETSDKIKRHFGCAHPEGYRKALLKMKFAEKYRLPIVTLIDTPGAYPGIGSEERGQAEAIARNLLEMSRLRTPIVSVVIGEGGSGGALGIGVGDRVAMLEHAWYSVISPEGCAAILWKEANEKTNNQAAESLHLTAKDNLKHGLVDAVIPEPIGGAHRDPELASDNIQGWVLDQLASLSRLKAETLVRQRFEKFRAIGPVVSMALPEG